jgi:hypothetical protein
MQIKKKQVNIVLHCSVACRKNADLPVLLMLLGFCVYQDPDCVFLPADQVVG